LAGTSRTQGPRQKKGGRETRGPVRIVSSFADLLEMVEGSTEAVHPRWIYSLVVIAITLISAWFDASVDLLTCRE
jgi:hypothetical protein